MADFRVLPRQKDEDIILYEEDYNEEKLKSIIRKMNLKVTQQRLLILKAFHDGRRHVTAQELFEKVVKIDSSIGFATVYRFLRNMKDLIQFVPVRRIPAYEASCVLPQRSQLWVVSLQRHAMAIPGENCPSDECLYPLSPYCFC